MAASQGFVVEEILSTYFFGEHQCVLDVGAGKGRFACDMAARAPHLQVKLFDLPPVLELAKNNVQQRGMSDRMSFYPGSFLHDELPKGADLVTLVRVAHDHPDDVVKQLLQKIHCGPARWVAFCCWLNPWRKPCLSQLAQARRNQTRTSTFICWPWARVDCARRKK
jgi:tRNA A58 N-methylase Trm61